MNRKDIPLILFFVFPICMVWLMAWLQIEHKLIIWGIGLSAYGAASVITLIITQIALWLWVIAEED